MDTTGAAASNKKSTNEGRRMSEVGSGRYERFAQQAMSTVRRALRPEQSFGCGGDADGLEARVGIEPAYTALQAAA